MFKKILIGLLTLGFLSGCASIGLNGSKNTNVNFTDGRPSISVEEFCAINTDSYLCGLDIDLGTLHSGLVLIAKEGIILDAFQYSQFVEATDKVIALIEAGISVEDLTGLLMMYVQNINGAIGMQILILSDVIFDINVPSGALLPKSDGELAVSSLKDIQKQLKKLALLI